MSLPVNSASLYQRKHPNATEKSPLGTLSARQVRRALVLRLCIFAGRGLLCTAGSILREQALGAILDDGAAGDDADEGVLIVHNGDEILPAGPLHQVVHRGGDPDG